MRKNSTSSEISNLKKRQSLELKRQKLKQELELVDLEIKVANEKQPETLSESDYKVEIATLDKKMYKSIAFLSIAGLLFFTLLPLLRGQQQQTQRNQIGFK
jgi:hypothetical protein